MNYLSQARKKQFEIPKYLELLVDKAIDLFNLSGISCVDMLQYMLEHDINNWVHYYAYTFIIPIAQGKSIEYWICGEGVGTEQKTVSGETEYTVTCSSKFVPYEFPANEFSK